MYSILDGEKIAGRKDIPSSKLKGELASRFDQEVDEKRDAVEIFTFPLKGETYTAVYDQFPGGWTLYIADAAGNLVQEDSGQVDQD
jgi:hypothetical protein